MNSFFIGCVADDFTGAADAASFLAQAGISTLLFDGIPDHDIWQKEAVQGIVIALKTRTMPVAEAVAEVLAAFTWLKQVGAEKLYFKYCSTFDSTADGNIGPVIDAVLEQFDIPYTVLCPSLPVNGRTVKDGSLYVNGVLLAESHMKDHPLTPMRQSRLDLLMQQQGRYETVLAGQARTWQEWSRKAGTQSHLYVVPDYYEEVHGRAIAHDFYELPFFTGGSGLIGALGAEYASRRIIEDFQKIKNTRAKGPAVLLAGSCSKVTLQQIEAYRELGRPLYQIDPIKLLQGEITGWEIWEWIQLHPRAPLVYSSASPDAILESQKYGRERISEKLEDTMAWLAVMAVEHGYKRIIVAGGETSGAVAKALECSSYRIGQSVASGVPILIPLEKNDIRLVLKSGNFGQEDFFERAVEMT